MAVGLPANDVCGAGSQISGTSLLTFSGGSLPAGGSCAFSVTLQIPAGLNANVSNTTSQISGTLGGQPATGPPASDVLQIAQADLSVVHTLESTDPVAPHGALAYQLQVANAGPGLAPNVRLADLLPAGTLFVSSTPGAPACVAAAGGLDCDLGDLPPSASMAVGIALTVDQNTSGLVTNSATVSSDAVDGALADNTTSESTTVQFVKGDLNYDARTDLVLRNGVTGETLAWETDGTVKVGESSLSPALAPSQAVGGTDDFTGDRRTDLVLRDASTGAVEFWALDGTTRRGAAIPLTGQAPPPLGWDVVATTDFNADGHPDLLWYDTTSRQIVVWRLDGTQYLGSVVPSPSQSVDGNWRVVAALDFNGDGHPDLLWFNLNSRKIVLWFMDGSVTRTLGAFTTPASATDGNWTVLAAGDYGLGPGQVGTPVPGSNDIVWRNESSGRFVVWHMDLAGMRTGARSRRRRSRRRPPRTGPWSGRAERAVRNRPNRFRGGGNGQEAVDRLGLVTRQQVGRAALAAAPGPSTRTVQQPAAAPRPRRSSGRPPWRCAARSSGWRRAPSSGRPGRGLRQAQPSASCAGQGSEGSLPGQVARGHCRATAFPSPLKGVMSVGARGGSRQPPDGDMFPAQAGVHATVQDGLPRQVDSPTGRPQRA